MSWPKTVKSLGRWISTLSPNKLWNNSQWRVAITCSNGFGPCCSAMSIPAAAGKGEEAARAAPVYNPSRSGLRRPNSQYEAHFQGKRDQVKYQQPNPEAGLLFV